MEDLNRYQRIIEQIFLDRYEDGAKEVTFEREDIRRAAEDLGIELPKNLGDVVYNFRYRAPLPESVRTRAPEGQEWIILPAGIGRYRFVGRTVAHVSPRERLALTKIPDATPGLIDMYALSDEQALLAKLRYNRLIDIFSGVTCYSLQNHLRTTVRDMGQVETDELYVGVDRKGAHYIFPVQAKAGSDKLSIVQIEQDVALCRAKFEAMICRPIGAQFMGENVIALFEFEIGDRGVLVSRERHYRLVPPEEVTSKDLEAYQKRLPDE